MQSKKKLNIIKSKYREARIAQSTSWTWKRLEKFEEFASLHLSKEHFRMKAYNKNMETGYINEGEFSNFSHEIKSIFTLTKIKQKIFSTLETEKLFWACWRREMKNRFHSGGSKVELINCFYRR